MKRTRDKLIKIEMCTIGPKSSLTPNNFLKVKDTTVYEKVSRNRRHVVMKIAVFKENSEANRQETQGDNKQSSKYLISG